MKLIFDENPKSHSKIPLKPFAEGTSTMLAYKNTSVPYHSFAAVI